MSCGPCDEKRRRDRMTRGEFIGAGAAAAAVASMGPVAAAAQVQPDGCEKPARCGPHADEEWEVSASVLQVLWGDIFPRFVAFRWANGGDYPAPIGSTVEGEIDPAALVLAIGNYTSSLPAGGAKDSFVARSEVALAYLQGGGDKIPIRLLGIGGFDFILSDAGIDLIAPRTPLGAADLLRFYEFRQTGRSTIGLPQYLDDELNLAFDVHAPVGPSQILLDEQGFVSTPINFDGTCTLEDLSDCLGDLETVQGTEIQGSDIRGRGRRISTRSLLAAAAKVRCWQLEGAVYRGILEQLPRVVATIWHEEATNCTGPQSYYHRFHNTPDGVREIFKERLETSLPDSEEMVFEASTGVADVMVTNQGIQFPTPGAAPSLTTMYTAMANGRAGNPVFTDSRRPPNM